MADLAIAGARKRFGAVEVLKGIDLRGADGEFVVVVGPSGCGKSTLLRSVAGLEELDGGTIHIGGRDVTHLPPAQRGIAMVFQNYALYPHLSLFENMAFALRLARKPEADIRAAVLRAAEILGIEQLLDRKPGSLSGGQRQRVAIGRAIVRSPDIFLFDEPLSNLDASLRVKMRAEFAALHRQLATTTLYVTHDQVEAMTLADRIVVLRDGQIEQIGSPDELYTHPANKFVAGFIGSPQMNFIGATVLQSDTDTLQLTADGQRQPLHLLAADCCLGVGEMVTLGFRPEDVALDNSAQVAPILRLDGRVRFIERLGGSVSIHFDVDGVEGTYCWQCRDAGSLQIGSVVPLGVRLSSLHVFDSQGKAIYFAR